MTNHAELDYLKNLDWFKAEASSGSSGCLEVAFTSDGRVAHRDNEDLSSPPFDVSEHVWTCILNGAASGEFDIMALSSSSEGTCR
ncbi:DUF397 domain-containing protein [Streptomyces althioticus]|jgi:hypothetical protein|uniref:DUF397 domain-containing protein n=1 Tax=Streptomyces TaxID=1883 RepID=UPI00351389A9